VSTIAFAFPIKPGMIEKGYKFIEEMGTQRADEHHAAHSDHGLKLMQVYHQSHPTEMVIVVVEADDQTAARQKRNQSSNTFDKWFDDMVMEITGHQPDDFDTTQLLDWHHQDKHRHVVSASAAPKR